MIDRKEQAFCPVGLSSLGQDRNEREEFSSHFSHPFYGYKQKQLLGGVSSLQ